MSGAKLMIGGFYNNLFDEIAQDDIGPGEERDWGEDAEYEKCR